MPYVFFREMLQRGNYVIGEQEDELVATVDRQSLQFRTDAIKWCGTLRAIVSLQKLKAEHVPRSNYPLSLGDILRSVNVDLRRRRARRRPDSAAS
jgi:hypothetical protein